MRHLRQRDRAAAAGARGRDRRGDAREHVHPLRRAHRAAQRRARRVHALPAGHGRPAAARRRRELPGAALGARQQAEPVAADLRPAQGDRRQGRRRGDRAVPVARPGRVRACGRRARPGAARAGAGAQRAARQARHRVRGQHRQRPPGDQGRPGRARRPAGRLHRRAQAGRRREGRDLDRHARLPAGDDLRRERRAASAAVGSLQPPRLSGERRGAQADLHAAAGAGDDPRPAELRGADPRGQDGRFAGQGAAAAHRHGGGGQAGGDARLRQEPAGAARAAAWRREDRVLADRVALAQGSAEVLRLQPAGRAAVFRLRQRARRHPAADRGPVRGRDPPVGHAQVGRAGRNVRDGRGRQGDRPVLLRSAPAPGQVHPCQHDPDPPRHPAASRRSARW